jgi:hypothetical protein
MYPKKRVKSQGYSDFEILNKSEDKFLAGELEIELQKQYGYKIDRVKYHQGKYKSMGHKGGAKSKELGHTKTLQQIGSKIASSLPRTESQMQQAYKVQKIGAAIAWAKPRTQKQIDSFKEARKIGCVMGGKAASAIMKERLRVPVAAYLKSDNSFVGEYISVSDCARELNLKPSDIFSCLNPNRPQLSTKGYTFKKTIK